MYTGFAVSHDTHDVFLLRSTYADRRSVEDNVIRCIDEQTGIQTYALDVELHTLSAGENVEEKAELLARDMVTGCDGVDDGYTMHYEPILVEPKGQSVDNALKTLARDYGASYTAVLAMFYAWQSIAQEHDDEKAINEFGKTLAAWQVSY